MILPSKSVFGDFNCAFNTKTLVSLRGQERPDGVIDVPGRDIFTCTTMNCPKDVFEDLMDLYPDTAENIKIRSLEKREVVMYYLQKERCRQIKKLGEKITKQDQIMFDKWIPQSTYEDTDSDDDMYHISKPYELKNLSPAEFSKESSKFE